MTHIQRRKIRYHYDHCQFPWPNKQILGILIISFLYSALQRRSDYIQIQYTLSKFCIVTLMGSSTAITLKSSMQNWITNKVPFNFSIKRKVALNRSIIDCFPHFCQKFKAINSNVIKKTVPHYILHFVIPGFDDVKHLTWPMAVSFWENYNKYCNRIAQKSH